MTETRQTRDVALVLAGGVAKGAFEAGALQVIAGSRANVCRIVASSSGALNATVFGAALRQGDARAGAERLAKLWSERATWSQIFDFSLSDVVALRAISTERRVRELLREEADAQLKGGRNPISLRLLVAVLDGVAGNIGDQPATTYESVMAFEGGDFDTAEGRERIFDAALASSAFPFLFPPFELEVGGRTVHGLDGGVVNNTPVKLALRDENAVDSGLSTVLVVAPYPRVVTEPPAMSGVSLASDLVEILIDERLYRDLREAEGTNQVIRGIDALASQGFTAAQLEQVRALVLEERRRIVDIVAIRPAAKLHGTAFTGFFDADVRSQYLAAGREAATLALTAAGLL
ncbi:MAG TPA: patatin-like phospholipase family protein [Polyangia bacterium]|nr:patatin-like phospholipase family protein [Polyangia bacterium]